MVLKNINFHLKPGELVLNIDETGYSSVNSDQSQPQPSALERLWTEYGGRDVITVQGRHLGTVQEFVNEIRRIGTPLPVVNQSILIHLIKVANLSLNDALALTQEIIAEIYNLDRIDAELHAMQLLACIKAHPDFSKRILK